MPFTVARGGSNTFSQGRCVGSTPACYDVFYCKPVFTAFLLPLCITTLIIVKVKCRLDKNINLPLFIIKGEHYYRVIVDGFLFFMHFTGQITNNNDYVIINNDMVYCYFYTNFIILITMLYEYKQCY